MTRINLDNARMIGSGTRCSPKSHVYEMGDKAVKTFEAGHLIPQDESSRLKKELDVAMELYNAGVRVPKPYGVFRIEINGRKTFGYVMQCIDGKNLDEFNVFEGRNEYEQIAKDEVDKAKSQGFVLHDRWCGNVMVSDNSQVYLIDFDGCESPRQDKAYQEEGR